MTIDFSKPVLVTGATGYVAGWLVKKLLDEGITVHAAIRDPSNKAKTKYLDQLAAESKGEIRYFKSDLLDKGSFKEAMQDCELVYHTASPFTLKFEDAQKELIEPALEGTRNVLHTANRVSSVKKIVVTSSCAAIYGDNIDLKKVQNNIFTEEDWNFSSSESHQPYSYSKTLAEREAWKIAGEQDRWKLVTVNPSLVLGPGINPKGTSESFSIVKQMGDGTMKFGAPAYYVGAVDVRDVAEVHFQAGLNDRAEGRYITSADSTSFVQLGKLLAQEFPKYPVPTNKLPKFLAWLAAPAAGLTRKVVSRNVGYPWRADNSKSIQDLGITYRPLKTSIQDMFQQMIDNGILKKR